MCVCWTKDHIQLRSKVKLRLTPVTSVWLFHATSHSKVVYVTPAKKNYDLQMISHSQEWEIQIFLSREATVGAKSPLFVEPENGLGSVGVKMQ